jgi:1,2-diacylglycerol 3-alpha-glucosyltransferase
MKESLKIAFYTDAFLPAVDGVVVSILNFRKELEKRGHEVYIFASGNAKTRQMVRNDKRVTIIRSIAFKKYPQYSVALFPLFSTLKLMNTKMDINHAHTPFMMGVHALTISKIDGTPIVGSFHTLFTKSSVIKEYTTGNRFVQKTITKYSWKYARLYYKRCDGVAAPSGTIRNMLERKGIKNVNVVPNGIDLKKFNPKIEGNAVREQILKNDKEKLIMYVGRISREKRIETLIKAASLMKNEDVRFALVGTGPAYTHYQHMVERMKLQDRVKFLGFVDNNQLPKYYAACDAFCIPSTFETQGVVALEAMACGKPVIGADYLALRELIVNGKNGEKFRAGDGTSCANKIRKVLYNINTYKDMVNTAGKYSIEKSTDDLLGLYRRVLDNKNS